MPQATQKLAFQGMRAGVSRNRNHLAVLAAPYLQALLAGRKKVECRLTRSMRPPYGQVSPGDLLWLKQSGGPVRGLAGVARVDGFADLTPAGIHSLKQCYGKLVAAPASFWHAHESARFATLIGLEWVCAVRDFRVLKRDRSAWLVLEAPPVPGRVVKRSEAGALCLA
jgi:hypothetical protein